MSFPLLHKRILLIRPIEAGDFPVQLINRLTSKGANVYVWVWNIDDVVFILDQLPDACIPIMVDDTVKKPARLYLRYLPKMDHVIKFSQSKDPLPPEFGTHYGYLFGRTHGQVTILELKRNVDKIIKKLEQSNGGQILNLGPPEKKNVLTSQFKKLMQPSSSRRESIENAPLLPEARGSGSGDAPDNTEVSFVTQFFGNCCCCFPVLKNWGKPTDIDSQIRERLREIHWNARNSWRGEIQDNSSEVERHYADLVQEQLAAFMEFDRCTLTED